jgi:hypothetical protein
MIKERDSKGMTATRVIYSADQRWFRGNLHCHTTNSDGALPPEEVIGHYASLGYDFLGLTDHLLLTDPEPYQRDDLLLIPAVELHGDEKAPGRTYHLVVFGPNAGSVAAMHQITDSAQTVINRAYEASCLMFLAHPYRLGMTTEEVLILNNLLGIEVYNHVSKLGGKALSKVYWDVALDAGLLLWGFANDDAHFRRKDYGGGWIMVQAATRDAENILDAIRSGRFYASTGPQFEELTLSGREVYVRCSPARAIRFVSNRMQIMGFEAEGNLLTEATWIVPSAGSYCRVEIEDEQGHSAWSQPMLLESEAL